MHAKLNSTRRVISVCVLVAFFVFFAFDLVKIQIIDGAEYDAASSAVSEKTASISASLLCFAFVFNFEVGFAKKSQIL